MALDGLLARATAGLATQDDLATLRRREEGRRRRGAADHSDLIQMQHGVVRDAAQPSLPRTSTGSSADPSCTKTCSIHQRAGARGAEVGVGLGALVTT